MWRHCPSPSPGGAASRRRTAATVGKRPTTAHRRARSRFGRSRTFVVWLPRPCSGGKSMAAKTSSVASRRRRATWGNRRPQGPGARRHSRPQGPQAVPPAARLRRPPAPLRSPTARRRNSPQNAAVSAAPPSNPGPPGPLSPAPPRRARLLWSPPARSAAPSPPAQRAPRRDPPRP